MIDIKTLFSVAGLINIVLSTGLLLLLWWVRRARYVMFWALADVAVTVATIVTGFALVLPAWVVFSAGNVMYLLATYLGLEGYQALLGTRRFTGLGLACLVLGATAAGIMLAGGADLARRMAVISAFGAPILLMVSILCFRPSTAPLRLPLVLAGALSGFTCLLSIARVVFTLIAPPTTDFFTSSQPTVAVLVGFGVAFLATNAVYLWLVLSDDAARHAAEQDRLLTQLRAQAVELRAAAEAKSAFLATMSHEIRTPLSGVIGFSDVLLKTSLSPQQRDYVELQRDAGRGLLALLNGILDFSKLEAGEVMIEPVDLDLAAAMESCCGLFGPAAQERQIRLLLELDTALPRWVRLDGYRLRQVISNLLSNAVKFTRGGEVALTICRQGERIAFAVRDTGIGIPADKQGELFRSFGQIDGSITRTYGGTGLGLAISRGLVELMGGKLEVESAVGLGARFFFDLPLEPGRPVVEPAAPILGRKLRILVAEDTDVNQMLIRLLLTEDGHAVTVVDNGASAVDAVSRQDYDLVLMDMQMPIMDGVVAAQRIRALPSAAGRLPILALTANVLPEDVAACRDAGMQGYLSKPIDPSRLRSAIAEIAAQPVGAA